MLPDGTLAYIIAQKYSLCDKLGKSWQWQKIGQGCRQPPLPHHIVSRILPLDTPCLCVLGVYRTLNRILISVSKLRSAFSRCSTTPPLLSNLARYLITPVVNDQPTGRVSVGFKIISMNLLDHTSFRTESYGIYVPLTCAFSYDQRACFWYRRESLCPTLSTWLGYVYLFRRHSGLLDDIPGAHSRTWWVSDKPAWIFDILCLKNPLQPCCHTLIK